MRAIAVLALLVMLGCDADDSDTAAQATQSGRDAAEFSVAQRVALADGEVSAVEYRVAFRRFADCLSEAGYVLLEHGEVDGRIDYGVPVAAVSSGAEERCYDAEFAEVDAQWQLALGDPESTLRALEECLAERDVTSDERTIDAMIEALERAGVSPFECS